jgi:hypothetical protein
MYEKWKHYYYHKNIIKTNIYSILLGTFGASDRLTNETECTQCSGGHYCDVQGLSAPAGVCQAGYYCVSGKF